MEGDACGVLPATGCQQTELPNRCKSASEDIVQLLDLPSALQASGADHGHVGLHVVDDPSTCLSDTARSLVQVRSRRVAANSAFN